MSLLHLKNGMRGRILQVYFTVGGVRMSRIVLILVAVALLFVVSSYKNLFTRRENLEKLLEEIEAYLQKRFHLIQSLSAQLEGVYDRESEAFQAVVAEREKLDQIVQTYQFEKRGIVGADLAVDHFFSRLGQIFEKHGEGKNMEAVETVLAEARSMEGDLKAFRLLYNETLAGYQAALQAFPNRLFAGIFGFSAGAYVPYPIEDIAQIEP